MDLKDSPSDLASPASAEKPRSLASDHLANERTFLAWIRTSLAVIGLGFAVAKFGTWLREMAGEPAHIAEAERSGLSTTAGIAMILTGGLFAAIAAWRYQTVSRQIERGDFKPARKTILFVAAMVLILTIAVTCLILTGSRH